MKRGNVGNIDNPEPEKSASKRQRLPGHMETVTETSSNKGLATGAAMRRVYIIPQVIVTNSNLSLSTEA